MASETGNPMFPLDLLDPMGQSVDPELTTKENIRLAAVDEFQKFSAEMASVLAGNASSYITSRVSNARSTAKTQNLSAAIANAQKLSRVLSCAAFTPAHVDRIKLGIGPSAPKFIALHRPGEVDTPPGVDKIYGARYMHERNVGLGRTGRKLFDAQNMCTVLGVKAVVRFFASAPKDGHKGSTHFVTGYNGEIVQMIDLTDAEYGAPSTIGIEIAGGIDEEVSPEQYRATAKLCCYLAKAFSSIDRPSGKFTERDSWGGSGTLLRHSNFYSQRRDPGEKFKMEVLLAECNRQWNTSEISLLSAGTVFKEAFDPSEKLQESMVMLASLAGAASDMVLKASITKAYERVYTENRKRALSYITRDDITAQAKEELEKFLANTAHLTAETIQKMNLATEIPALKEEAYRGVRYNFDTGLWETEA